MPTGVDAKNCEIDHRLLGPGTGSSRTETRPSVIFGAPLSNRHPGKAARANAIRCVFLEQEHSMPIPSLAVSPYPRIWCHKEMGRLA